MKAYIVAFLTLAAAVTAISDTKFYSDPKKIEFLRTIRNRMKESEKNKKERSISLRYMCSIRSCVDVGNNCTDDDFCADYSKCMNGKCGYGKEGDYCYYDYECNNTTLLCNRNKNECKLSSNIGDSCTHDDDCRVVGDEYELSSLYCKNSGSVSAGHCEKKPEGYCTYNGDYSCSSYTSYCTATEESRTGVCKDLPSVLDAACDPELGEAGCNLEKNLYCSEQTKKCLELPKTGQSCLDNYYAECYPGYYCDGDRKCNKLKEKGKECGYDDECEGDLKCLYNSENKKVCTNYYAKKGEHCSNESYDDHPKCESPLVCEDNKCVDKGYECLSGDECIKYGLAYGCIDHKCKGGMQTKEGEECYFPWGYLGLRATLQCQEGLLCVEDPSLGKSVCKKPKTKMGELNCSSDSDCPYDATCECDDRYGVSVCVPKLVSSKKLMEMNEKYYIVDENEFELPFYEYLIEEHQCDHEAYYYCGAYKEDYEDKSAASSLRASAVMTIFMALVALLSFF